MSIIAADEKSFSFNKQSPQNPVLPTNLSSVKIPVKDNRNFA